MSTAALGNLVGFGCDTTDEAYKLAERAQEESFRMRMFGDPRRVEKWNVIRLFKTSRGQRAHVVRGAGISKRFDGVRIGDPYVTSLCDAVWAFADDVSLEVDQVPICKSCDRLLASS